MRCHRHGGEGFEYDQCDMCQQAEIDGARSKREMEIAIAILENSRADREARERANTEAVEAAERASTDATKAAIEAAYLTNNPGDYECPTCKMISLRNNALRCPKCQKDVPANFWEILREKERAEALQMEERRRLEQAEQKLAEEKAAEEQRRAEEEHRKWLASPEYALEVERKKIASETALARAKLESEAAARIREKRKLEERLVGLGWAGGRIVVGIGLLLLPLYLINTDFTGDSAVHSIWDIAYRAFLASLMVTMPIVFIVGIYALITGLRRLLSAWWPAVLILLCGLVLVSVLLH